MYIYRYTYIWIQQYFFVLNNLYDFVIWRSWDQEANSNIYIYMYIYIYIHIYIYIFFINLYISDGLPLFLWIMLLCMCVLSCFSCVQFFVTPWTVARQAPLSMGFCRQEYWSGLPCSPPGDLPDPGFEPSSAVQQTDCWATGKP